MPNDSPSRPASLTLGDLIAHVEERIAAARVRTLPFPHIVVDDLLPEPVRRTLDSRWPDPERFQGSNHLRRGEVRVGILARAAEGQDRNFWNALRHLVASANRKVRARLDRHLHEKFRPLLGPGWRRTLGAVTYQDNDAMLAHYTGTLDMAPHIDHVMVAVNGFVYLDDPAMATPEPRRGTMLYRSLGFAWPTNYPIPQKVHQRLLREATEIEWRDNRLLAYVNGPWSFHGVPKHELGDSRRRLLMFGSLLDRATVERLFDPAIR